MPVLVQISIVVATIAMVAVAIPLIRAIGQLRRTAETLERVASRVEQTIPDVERAVLESRELLDTLGNVAKRVDRVAGEFTDVGHRLARTTSMVVDEVVDPVTRVAAVVRGVKTGASALFDAFARRRSFSNAASSTGGNHDE